MKNKFYLFKKKRNSLFLGLLLCSGFYCSTLQAQFTHRWNAATGNWGLDTNWQVFTTTADFAVLGTATATFTATFTGDITGSVRTGDFIRHGVGTNTAAQNNAFVIGNTVAGISHSGGITTVTMKIAMNTTAGVSFRFQRPTSTGATFPAAASNILIDSGVCTLSDARAATFLIVGNTDTDATFGTLQIAETGRLTVSGTGVTTSPNVSVRGGVIDNNGELISTNTSANGSPISLANGVANVTGRVWGITGAGILTLRNSGTNANNGGFFNITQTGTNTPEIWVNDGSTATLAAPVAVTGPFAIINLNANGRVFMRGAGLVGPSTCPLLRPGGSGFVCTIDAGTTFTTTYAAPPSGIAGTLRINGTVVNDGLIPVFPVGTPSGAIDGSGTLVLKSNKVNPLILTLNTTAALTGIALGEVYTTPIPDSREYTVIEYARPASAIGAGGRLVVSTPTNKGFAVGTVLTRKDPTSSAPATITATAVVQVGEGYVTYDKDSPKTIRITQQRYLSSNQRGWRLFSNPLSDTTIGDVASGSTTPITLGASTVKTYNSGTNTWTNNTDNAQIWPSKGAIAMFIRGRTSEVTTNIYSANPPSNVTLAVSGTTSNAVPATINTTAKKYYLVANPYTAPVSVAGILGASTGLSTTVSYQNPTVGSDGSSTQLILRKGGYNTPSISGAAGSSTDLVIPPMGAIFVLASTDGTINVPRTAIFTGPALQTGTYNHKTAQEVATNDLKLEVVGDNTYYDTVALRFKAIGDAGTNIDFGKFDNEVLNGYSLNETNKMAVSELELKEQSIVLGVKTTIEKAYTFKVAENTIPAGFEAVLVDNLLNKSITLNTGSTYNFSVDSNVASQGNDRFVINLKSSGSLSVSNPVLAAKFQVWPNPASGKINISNGLNLNDGDSTVEISTVNGKLVHTQKSKAGSTTTIQTANWAKGLYILKASNKGNQTSKKLIIQ